MLEKVEWSTIMFFCGLFMMVGALEEKHVFSTLGQYMVDLTRGNFALTMMIILWGGALLSAIIDNIPLVIARIPLIKSIIPVFAKQMGIEAWRRRFRFRSRSRSSGRWRSAPASAANGTLIGASGQRGICADRAEEQLSALFQAVHDVRFPDDAAEPRDLFGLSVFAVHPLRRGDGEVRSGRAGFFYIRTTRLPGRRGSRF